jgi:alpha-L-fucosidase
MRKIIFILLTIASPTLYAQPYSPSWQSLDQRPVPQWYRDAKFGIFIHWGVYSVPGWSSKGNYAEWYQNGLNTGDGARIRFHRQKFGNLTYYQLADQFKAELYNPDEWAKLFEQSGAKYIVLTSKHHDGYSLWPDKTASRTWGFPWNAAERGPGRDLLGDLFKAVRKTSVHAGMYYSLYEWFNPLWKTDRKKFVEQHAWPQMKDLINNYQPDVFWTDGDWDATDELWKSKEFLAWLYNESPVKDKVVTIDRWGSGVRFNHGAVFTPEYEPDLDFEDHYFEESRGMGYSYGYNREEDAWDYNSTQSLVLHLTDKVSRGGNFLLDIGPDEHGKIPPIMQERLLQIGEWLQINGEAIYGTSRWKTSSQWTEGRMGYKPKKGEDYMLKTTVDPQQGYATRDVFYTYNAKNNTLYAILPKYPSGRELLLRNINLPSASKVTLLSTSATLAWKVSGENTVVSLPEYDPNKIKAPYAYVIKITGYGKFVHKPKIGISYEADPLVPLVSISSVQGSSIRYTTDGSEPTASATLYTKPFNMEKTGVVKATAFADGNLSSSVTVETAARYQWMPAVKAGKTAPGIAYKYYEPNQNINLGVAETAQPVKSGVATVFSLQEKQRREQFVFSFEGLIKVNKDAVYVFSTNSDDGSKLFIDDVEVVDNDGTHGAIERKGKAALKKGWHRVKVVYFDAGGSNDLKVMIQAPGEEKKEIPANMLFH